MKTISTTVEYKGNPVKVENGRVYLRAFGTTIYNKTMHHSWIEVPKDRLRKELKDELEKKGLL